MTTKTPDYLRDLALAAKMSRGLATPEEEAEARARVEQQRPETEPRKSFADLMCPTSGCAGRPGHSGPCPW